MINKVKQIISFIALMECLICESMDSCKHTSLCYIEGIQIQSPVYTPFIEKKPTLTSLKTE